MIQTYVLNPRGEGIDSTQVSPRLPSGRLSRGLGPDIEWPADRPPKPRRNRRRPPVDPSKDRHGKTFRDPVVSRHAVLLACVVGCERAEEITGFNRTTISRWRRRLEAQTGERFPRIPNPGNTGCGKLSLAVARKIRERRSRGVSWGIIANIHGVSRAACIRVCKGILYPEPGQ